MPPQSRHSQSTKQHRIENTGEHKHFSINLHLRIVGAHTEAVKGIGIEESQSLAGGQQAADTAHQADADGDGERADHHGEGKLDAADNDAAQGAAEKPLQGLRGKSGIQPA